MNIFEGLQFCYDNQFRSISAHGIKPIFFHCTEKIFLIEQPDGEVTEFNINSPILFNVSFEPVIVKQPLNELFSFWIDGGVVCCEINGKEWIIDKCYFKALSGDDDRMHVTPELAKQPIWWVKE